MALIVEDGTGLPNAESYASVASAVARLTAFGDGAAFLALSSGDQEIRLRRATEWLDLTFGQLWRGRRKDRDQSLDWPRVYVVDDDGWSIGFDSVPPDLVGATIEMAANSASDPDIFPDIAAGAGVITGESKSVGPLSKSVTYASGSARETKYYRKAHSMVAGLLRSTSEVGKS